jgi:hypothetical protein
VAIALHSARFWAQCQSLKDLNQQLRGDGQSPEFGEIDTPQTGRWEVRSSLLNLDPGEILLCQRGDEFAAIERFGEDSPYAKSGRRKCFGKAMTPRVWLRLSMPMPG